MTEIWCPVATLPCDLMVFVQLQHMHDIPSPEQTIELGLLGAKIVDDWANTGEGDGYVDLDRVYMPAALVGGRRPVFRFGVASQLECERRYARIH